MTTWLHQSALSFHKGSEEWRGKGILATCSSPDTDFVLLGPELAGIRAFPHVMGHQTNRKAILHAAGGPRCFKHCSSDPPGPGGIWVYEEKLVVEATPKTRGAGTGVSWGAS